jgi:hypothetical protein
MDPWLDDHGGSMSDPRKMTVEQLRTDEITGRVVDGIGTPERMPPGGYPCDNGCGELVGYMGDEFRQYNGCPNWMHLAVVCMAVKGRIIAEVVPEDSGLQHVRWLHFCPKCSQNPDNRFRRLGYGAVAGGES